MSELGIGQLITGVQTLDNLEAFGARLASIHDQYFKGTHRCACG